MIVAGLAGCAGSTSSSPTAAAPSASAQTVRLATNPVSPSNGFVWVGKKTGVLDSPGLRVDVQGLGGAQRSGALVAGQIDAEAGGGPQELVAANARGSRLTIVATFSRRFDDVLLVPNEITSVDQLKGKKIGAVTTTSVDAQGLVFFLRKYGMEPGRDYSIIGVGVSASQAGPAAAMAARQIDGALLQDDFARGVVAQGAFHVLADLYNTDLTLPGVPLDFRADFIHQHPDLVQKTVDGLIWSVRYTKEHPAETKADWSARYKIDDPARTDTMYQREMELWQSDPLPDVDAVKDVIDFMSLTTPDVTSLDPSALIDSRFVADAEKRGLTNF